MVAAKLSWILFQYGGWGNPNVHRCTWMRVCVGIYRGVHVYVSLEPVHSFISLRGGCFAWCLMCPTLEKEGCWLI